MISLSKWNSRFGSTTSKTLMMYNQMYFSSSSSPKTGILMMNLGGPKKSEDAADFMYNMFTDPQTVPILKRVPNWIIRKL